MMLFFVEGEIIRTPYMGEGKALAHRCLVQADDVDQAEEKYREYWSKQTEEYSVYYYVADCMVSETII